ncbi:MAG: M28 family peptidase [Ignavibacteriae bacterium]|nr:M28 family peptidase [Ignavibacteriota bacterium]
MRWVGVVIWCGLLCGVAEGWAQEKDVWREIIGSAYLDNGSYSFLQRLCDEAGGRLTGSAADTDARGILQEELRKLGIESRQEEYHFPGFVRGDDRVTVRAPFEQQLRAVALGYTDATPAFEARLVALPIGDAEDFRGTDCRGAVVLAGGENAPGRPTPLRYETIDFAAKHGARAVLFVNNKPGGLTLVGVTNFQGTPSPVPAFSITLEEGKRLQRLLAAGRTVTVGIDTRSRCQQLESANVVATFPGKTARKIVIGAHFDSWDVSQGAVDNGVGSAILFDVARLLHRFARNREYTIECVWFNGEELGLWGAKKYIERHTGDDIAALINMDMTGTPTGFNAMGIDALIPFLAKLAADMPGFNLSSNVANTPWTNSDHQPFMLHGIPAITLQAHLDETMVRHYHDFGDTFDKVSRKYLSDAAAVVSVLVFELANHKNPGLVRRSRDATIDFLKKHKLEETLRKQREWIFE